VLKTLPYGLGDLTWDTNLGYNLLENNTDNFYFNDEILWFLNIHIIQKNDNNIRFLDKTLNDITHSLDNNVVGWDILLQNIIYIKNTDKINQKVIIFYGSSLSGILPLYFELFNEAYFIKEKYSNDFINLINPDVVFEFCIERFLD